MINSKTRTQQVYQHIINNTSKFSLFRRLSHISTYLVIPAHPNTKLFITHGGLLSTLEAIQAGVPLLAVPVFGDQPGNARRAERDGYAISVPFSPDMGDKLKVALDELLGDDRLVRFTYHTFIQRHASFPQG